MAKKRITERDVERLTSLFGKCPSCKVDITKSNVDDTRKPKYRNPPKREKISVRVPCKCECGFTWHSKVMPLVFSYFQTKRNKLRLDPDLIRASI